MDNLFSQPSIEMPEVPSDFEAKAGSSRVDFYNAIKKLIESATIKGINAPTPTPYDLTALEQRVTAVEEQVADGIVMRQVLKAGATDATITVDFESVGRTDYSVTVAAITTDTNINTVTWSLIEDSRTVNQCKIRIDGTGAGYTFLVTILSHPPA